jgi:hypothetical protein
VTLKPNPTCKTLYAVDKGDVRRAEKEMRGISESMYLRDDKGNHGDH